MTRRDVLVQHDVEGRMRDGVVLRANVYRPADGGTYPVLLSRQPYNKDVNYTLTYGVNTMGLSRTTLLWLQITVNVIALAAIPAAGLLADRIGRKKVYAVGVLGTAAMIWPFIWAVSQRNMPLIWVFGIVMVAGFYSGYGGAAFALWSEQFDTRVRMSGVAVGTQFGFALGGFAPAIAAGLAGPKLENWVPVAAFTCAAAVISVIAALTMRETYRTPLYDLGKPARSEVGSRA